MANSFVRYTGNNSTTAYSIPFSYRTTGDLTVTLAGVATTAFTLNAAGTTLTFTTAPQSGYGIEVMKLGTVSVNANALTTNTFTANGSTTALWLWVEA